MEVIQRYFVLYEMMYEVPVLISNTAVTSSAAWAFTLKLFSCDLCRSAALSGFENPAKEFWRHHVEQRSPPRRHTRL